MDEELELYEGWESDDGLAFFPASHAQADKDAIIGPGERKLVFICQAASWEDAMRQWHEFNDWESYIPLQI